MEVQLYVYDLSRGMARAMSQQFLGIQIDAVYHTSLVFGNVEYFFGMGVQTAYPGRTHHGQPMEIVPMGTTHLPIETIMEYLDGLKEIYTPESYDLFAHNCNNFTNDFGMFLVGNGIPDHITSLPKRVLETPFGSMLKSQIDASMRGITQAPVPPQSRPKPTARNGSIGEVTQGHNSDQLAKNTSSQRDAAFGTVLNVTEKAALDQHLQSANSTAATIFFTSSTCAPCRIAYPMFDQLAEQYGQAVFIKVDISKAHEIAMHYQIRATPTFLTFSKGVQQVSWSGADPKLLKANVDKLMQETFPPHPHTLIKVPSLQFGPLKAVTYTRTPPLEKLSAKLGPAAGENEFIALRSFLQKRETDPRDAKLPDLKSIGRRFREQILELPIDVRFAAVDLLRCAMADPRVGGFYAEEPHHQTVSTLIKHVNELEGCPHSLRLVTIHLACNLFVSPLYVRELMRSANDLTSLLIPLVTSSLLDASHPTARVAGASLAFNIASTNYRIRREEEREALRENDQVELAAGLIESLSGQESADVVKPLLLALGYLIYCSPQDGELVDLAKALDAKNIIGGCKVQGSLANEVASLL